MLFSSIAFAIFLPIVFFLNWFVTNRNHKAQNILLLIASYVFYGWWDWRFLFLIATSTVMDFWLADVIARSRNPGQRRSCLAVSLVLNFGFLGFFKYFSRRSCNMRACRHSLGT